MKLVGILYVLISIIIQKGYETNIVLILQQRKQRLNEINKLSSDILRLSHSQNSHYLALAPTSTFFLQ